MPSQTNRRTHAVFSLMIAGLTCVSASCRSAHADSQPSIQFTRVPVATQGSSETLDPIEGRVRGNLPGQRIVLFALSGVWWVQPLADHPFTAIHPDLTWKNVTHPGTAYAALLVDSHYSPPLTVNTLPEKGGPVVAEAIIQGTPESKAQTLEFSGYRWQVRQTPSDHGGFRNLYSPANVSVDSKGFLHLLVSKKGDNWQSAEVALSRSLGYGSYRFVVRQNTELDPAAVFAMFTWDDAGPPREMDIEVSRWGEPEDKNAQFVIQPYVVPANTVRFEAPTGTLTYRMDWGPGRVSFKAIRGASDVVAEHLFTSGVPSAGSEKIHMIVYVYSNKHHPLEHGFETVIEKFEFLP